jgi:hypothetical protein
MVDAVLLHHFSVPVTLELRSGTVLAFLPGPHTYIPMLSFHAEVQLAYMDAGRPVFLVVSDLMPLPAAGATKVVLSAGLEEVQPPEHLNCRRYVRGTAMTTWVLRGKAERVHKLFRAVAGTSLVSL